MTNDNTDSEITTEIVDPDAPVKFLRVTGDEELAMIPWVEAVQIATAVNEERRDELEALAEWWEKEDWKTQEANLMARQCAQELREVLEE